MNIRQPPSYLEIVGLPVAGAILIEVFHNRRNELILFAVPSLVAVIRLFMSQFQGPRAHAGDSNRSMARAVRSCIGFNQVAVIPLFVLECAVVLAIGASADAGAHASALAALWLVIIGIFLVYILLRLISRRYWLIASQLGQ